MDDPFIERLGDRIAKWITRRLDCMCFTHTIQTGEYRYRLTFDLAASNHFDPFRLADPFSYIETMPQEQLERLMERCVTTLRSDPIGYYVDLDGKILTVGMGARC